MRVFFVRLIRRQPLHTTTEDDMKQFTKEEVSRHNASGNCWIIVKGKVYDVSTFAREHPGGQKILESVGGKDATEKFDMFHSPEVLQKYANLQIGEIVSETKQQGSSETTRNEGYGASSSVIPSSWVPYGDPAWEQGFLSPYYKESHHRLRKAMREWVEKEIMPYVHDWDEAKEFPASLRKKCAEAKWLPGAVGLLWPTKLVGGDVIAGVNPSEFDYFHESIIHDELSRPGSVGLTWGLFQANGIAIPPIVDHGSQYLIERVVKPVLKGDKSMSLCITEPYGGSDVGNLQTTAKKTPDGKYYVVNGEKKWITNGIYADFFTVAVRTGGPGYNGISLLVLERGMPGLKTKKMDCMGVWPSGTAYVTFEDVKVPVENLVGQENHGFKYVMFNFNHERWGVAIQAMRMSRVCIEESYRYAQKRKTFGKPLIENQVIRAKLGNMIRQVEALQAYLEQITYQMTKMSRKKANIVLSGPIALLKVQATLVVEHCAREAIQIFGGLGFTRGGQGDKVERIYREVRSLAIGGGSEEILLDLGVRQAMKLQQQSKL